MLLVGAGLMIFAGVVFALTSNFILLLIAATLGVISTSAGEIGPFLAIEQATLSHIVSSEKRTKTFAWYNLVGSFATAFGSFAGGAIAQSLQGFGFKPLQSYQAIVITYAALGVVLLVFFNRLSPAAEVVWNAKPETHPSVKKFFGLHRSQKVVFQLSALFVLDSFGGGFVLQSIVAYWFFIHFAVQPAVLGSIFFGSNLLAGFSALAAAALAKRIGLIRTMVFTHIPANIFLILVPLMPNLPLAIFFLLLRACVSSMDVPARQSYTMAVVSPDERSATAGITSVVRQLGSSFSPILGGLLMSNSAWFNSVFFLAGGVKIIYDLSLFYFFRNVKPPEEKR
jgi:MFS family permease